METMSRNREKQGMSFSGEGREEESKAEEEEDKERERRVGNSLERLRQEDNLNPKNVRPIRTM